MDEALRKVKVFKVSPDSKAGVVVTEGEVLAAGSPETAILVSGEYGIILKGKIAITEPIDSIRVAGLWRFSGDLMSCIPSTAVTPIRTLEFELPAQNFVAAVDKIMKFLEVL